MIGRTTTFNVPGWELKQAVPVELWVPADSCDDDDLPLVIANDGPEHKTRSGLVDRCARLIELGQVVSHRIALIEPVYKKRDEWYSASPAYTRVFAESVIPDIREKVSTGGIIGVGASLGATAMLKTAATYPELFDGLFLQSGAFHIKGLDDERSGTYGEYNQVTTFVDSIITAQHTEHPLHINMTCGDEHNMDCNVIVADALQRQGHDVRAIYAPGEHTFEVWAKSIEPQLGELLARTWGKPNES